MSNADIDEPNSSTSPDPDDGFTEPSETVKRRNRITAFVIVAFVIAWVLYGLRHVLF